MIISLAIFCIKKELTEKEGDKFDINIQIKK